MNRILAFVFLAFLPVCAALNCYFCTSATRGCGNPFNSSASDVTMISSGNFTYCVKVGLLNNLVSRYGSPRCVNTPFALGLGMACCQTENCNNAHGTYQMPLLITLSFLIMLFKIC